MGTRVETLGQKRVTQPWPAHTSSYWPPSWPLQQPNPTSDVRKRTDTSRTLPSAINITTVWTGSRRSASARTAWCSIPSAERGSPASTERPRSTPAAPASGSTNTAASATGQRQQTGRNARPRPTLWRPQTDSSAPRRPLLTSLANTILIPSTPTLTTAPSSSSASTASLPASRASSTMNLPSSATPLRMCRNARTIMHSWTMSRQPTTKGGSNYYILLYNSIVNCNKKIRQPCIL